MKKIFIIAGMLSAGVFYAQSTGQDGSVGINAQPSGATLDVQISADAVKTEGQGIAVPRVTKQQLSEMTGTIAEGALVYVNTIGDATGAATARIADVTDANGVGFYYFDKTKWVKVGGGASSSTSTTKNVIQSIKSTNVDGEVATLNTLKSTDWKEGDYTFVLQTGFSGNVELPDPTQNKGRVIALRNVSGANRNIVPYTPTNNATINTNRGLVLHSDGEKWQVIGGF